MLIISLDEQGDFEKDDNLLEEKAQSKPQDNLMFVAGVIFDDKDCTDEETIEKSRIAAYYKSIMQDLETENEERFFPYPNALHSNGNRWRDYNIVRPTKNKVKETIAEFFCFGTYKGKALLNDLQEELPARQGHYHLFAILKSDKGIEAFIEDDANMLAHDNFAANRYFHMAGRIVLRLAFHNPLVDRKQDKAIRLDIASRSSCNLKVMDEETAAEFATQKYKEIGQDSFPHYSIMNGDIYRTLIAQELVNTGKLNIRIKDLDVSSIKYRENALNMEFLYLSDSICSILGFNHTSEKADGWLSEIDKRIQELNPSQENLLFAYDCIDEEYTKAWDLYEREDVFDALSTIYDANREEDAFAEFYKKKWFKLLEERIIKEVTPETFSEGVIKLQHMLEINNLDQEKFVFLMNNFESMLKVVESSYESKDMLAKAKYQLYDAGVSAYTYIGDSDKALLYYDKCKALAYFVDISDFLRTNIKLAICYEDNFDFTKAQKILEENVKYQKQLSDLKREIFGHMEDFDYAAEAKAICYLARILAVQRDTGAEALFREALAMQKADSADYKRTQSNLLHYYADMGVKDAFEQEATLYFDGRASYADRYHYVMNMGEEEHAKFSKEFAIYVFLRGLYYFCSERIDDRLWNELKVIKNTWIEKTDIEPSGHPWEISYKYLQLLALKRGDKEVFDYFETERNAVVTMKGKTIQAIDLFSCAEMGDVCNATAVRDRYTKRLAEYLKAHFEVFKDYAFNDDGDLRYEQLSRVFTFMYR